ncbi:MAG: hypothetical protein WCT50_01070 [Patescibacteria group bacterium]|jgi:hypothetical protein
MHRAKEMVKASLEQKIKWLFELNKFHSEKYNNERLVRRFYRAQHPTEISAFKCMDGRIHIPLMTRTPLGIIRPYRSLGGRFDLGWPYLAEDLNGWIDYSISRGRKSLILVTYHFSCGDVHRGCAGFNYDKVAAFQHAISLRAQVERIYGKNNSIVFPIIVGVETDNDSLIFHGEDHNQILDLVKEKNKTEQEFLIALRDLYPNMSDQVLDDILPLIKGNIEHIKEIAAENRPIVETQHQEWILGLGNGFDWLHIPNISLIIGPYGDSLEEPIKKAAGIIQSNMEAGRISDDGFVLLTSATFKELGSERNKAIERVRFLKDFAKKTIEAYNPELAKKMHILSVVINFHTREFEEIAW